MKRSRIWMLLGVVLILFTYIIVYGLNSAKSGLDNRNYDLMNDINSLETKNVSNITLILNYYDGENVTYTDISLIGDISPYNATLVILGIDNIDEYWATNGVFIRGLRINSTWYTNGDGGRNWLYYINGILPGISSSEYELNNDSTVEWKFTGGNPFQDGNDPNDDSLLYTGLFIGIVIICAIGLFFFIKKEL